MEEVENVSKRRIFLLKAEDVATLKYTSFSSNEVYHIEQSITKNNTVSYQEKNIFQNPTRKLSPCCLAPPLFIWLSDTYE